MFELDLEVLLKAEVDNIRYTAIPRFPSITRDIALVVDEHVVAGELQKAIIEAGGELLKDVSIFDVYKGDRLPEGKNQLPLRSVTTTQSGR